MQTIRPLPSAKGGAILVVAEGADWLVVSKPPHLLVHPTRPGGPVTLLDLLRRLLACELASGGQVSLIHRLDRETSGLMLIAKTAEAARRFSMQMMRGQIHKEYLALVRGWPEWDARTLDAPLLRQGERQASRIWLKQMVHPEGAPARTDFAVLRRFERQTPGGIVRFSLVRAVPLTGRLHQIRVHLAHLGHPVAGDKIYGPDEGAYLRFIETGWTPELARALLLDRHALHAHRLEVVIMPTLEGDPAEGAGQDARRGGRDAHPTRKDAASPVRTGINASSPFTVHRSPFTFSSPLPEDLRAFMEV